MQVADDLSGSAAQITDGPQAIDLFDQPIQHLPIEGLVLQLVVELAGIFLSHEIVAGFEVRRGGVHLLPMIAPVAGHRDECDQSSRLEARLADWHRGYGLGWFRNVYEIPRQAEPPGKSSQADCMSVDAGSGRAGAD